MEEKKVTLILDVQSMNECFFDRATLLGIATSLESHKVAILLNQYFGLDFYRAPDLDIEFKNKSLSEPIFFPVYEYCEPYTENRHLLYAIKLNTHRLLPELKTLDYVWMIQTNDIDNKLNSYKSAIKTLPGIQMGIELKFEELKSYKNLVV